MVSKHSESTQAHVDAVAILDAEAQKRIAEIRQQVEFMCTAVRAQGNTQINGLNLAIRRLTMREFCHEYGANNITIFQQLAKARLAQARKRPRDEMEKQEDESAASAPVAAVTKPLPRRRHRQQQQTSEQSSVEAEEPTRPPIKRVKRVLPQRAVKGKNSKQVVKRVRVEHPKDSSPEEEEEEDVESGNKDTDIVDGNGNTAVSSSTEAAAQSEEEEEFGPMFVHLERPNHPRVGFQLDPQRTADGLGHFTVHMPDEVFSRMNQTQRDRLYSQIQDIQDQLDKVKSRLRSK